MMNGRVTNVINFKAQFKNNSENYNEITLKIKINKSHLNKYIYFLDNTTENDNKLYYENDKIVKHNHDNLREMNKNNVTLIIDGKIVSFKKFLFPQNLKRF